MLDKIAILEIACRASNLYERLFFLKKISIKNNSQVYVNKLNSLDIWLINKLVGKLAVMQIQQHLFQPLTSNALTEPELHQRLTEYKLYERNLINLSETEQLQLINFHAEWLDIYINALETLNLPKSYFSKSAWLEPNVYYGRFAKVCEPFLRLIQQKLQVIFDEVAQNSYGFRISTDSLTNLQFELINRFEMKLARAVEADINIYCYKNNIAKSSNPKEYISYLENTFNNENSYHIFYSKFPVLARWIATITKFIISNGKEVIQRITQDKDEIINIFFNNQKIKEITSFKLGKSDFHNSGHSVVFIEIELTDYNQTVENKILVYKPRCVEAEAAIQGLLKILNEAGVADFPIYQVLCKNGYGYVEYIPLGKNQVESKEQIQKFYNQLGGYLAIFYILGGSDLHFENIIAVYNNAFICDCETALEVILNGMEKSEVPLFNSVFKTGMLDWPQGNLQKAKDKISLTGYKGGESYQTSFAVPKITNRMSLALAVEQQVGVIVDVSATNRLFYNGQLIEPQEHQHSIVDGFNRVYLWFESHKTQGVELIQDLFATCSIRFVNRATQVYAHLLNASQHAKCLSDPLEVDLIFYSLVKYPRSWDETGQLAELELTSLWQQDIPIFTAKASSRDLIYNYQLSLAEKLAISPIENATRRIQQLSEAYQIRQNQYIYASLSTSNTSSEYFTLSAVDYAYQIGLQLCTALQNSSSSAPWKTIDITSLGKKVVNIDGSLYKGSAGICLFLAYLHSIRPNEKFRYAAEIALANAITQRDDIRIGAFQGFTGLIYLLSHLATLWNKPEFLDRAYQLATQLTYSIEQDYSYDIIHGVAGVIPVMLSLAKVSSGKGLEQAKQCAQHLLKNAIINNRTLSWPCNPELAKANLTGFSHGSAGIGWALIMLGCHIKESEYIISGLKAFAYEATQFNQQEQNWYDLRTSVIAKDGLSPKFAYYWCSGSAGIGLSRITSWAALGKSDEALLQEAYTALSVTLRSFHKLDNDSLCHGRAGNAELLIRFSQLTEQPYLKMEANVQAIEQWRNFEQTRHWACGAGGGDVPGLMMGLAGIGIHFLRLAYPELIPSPLLLDPPQTFFQESDFFHGREATI